MIDIIKDAYLRVKNKNTTVNKVRLLRRYLRMKYRLDISRASLIGRLREWKKQNV